MRKTRSAEVLEREVNCAKGSSPPTNYAKLDKEIKERIRKRIRERRERGRSVRRTNCTSKVTGEMPQVR